MSRILLVRPPQIHWRNEAKRVAAPLGLLSIASHLRNNDQTVGFLDATIEGYEQEREIKKDVFEFGLEQSALEQRIKELDPDFVGVQSSLTCYFNQARAVANAVKSVKPEAKVVFGGQHASGAAEWILSNENSVDYIIVGEGEDTFLKLVRDPPPTRKIINGTPANLERLTRPAFDLLDASLYTQTMSHFGKPRGQNFITNVITRGCPSACDFCTSSHYFGRGVRYYSLEQVAEQIDFLKKYGFEEYVSQDDNVLSLPSNFRKSFFKLLKDSGMHWNLDGGLYYSKVTPALIDEIAENGCYRVFLPVENPDIEIMHRHGKYQNLKSSEQQKQKIDDVIALLNSAGIEFYSAIMLGFPGESWSSVVSAVQYGKELKEKGALGIGFHWTHPYPFTPFYQQNYHLVSEQRKWEHSPELYTITKPVFPIDGITLEEAEEYVNGQSRIINGTEILNNSCFYT